MNGPSFPPLLSGQSVDAQVDPFNKACAQAALGCDAGLVVYNLGPDVLRAAIVFAPEVALEDAMAMLPACGVGFQNALGALAPPEVAVHLGWDGGILVNGAACGNFRVAASSHEPAAVPDWLVVGITVPLLPAGDRPGDTPDQTCLYGEGCSEVEAAALLESWSKHTLVWINRWLDDGTVPLHAEWRGLADKMGADVEQGGKSGKFVGVDERFGMLLRDGEKTRLIALTSLLEDI